MRLSCVAMLIWVSWGLLADDQSTPPKNPHTDSRIQEAAALLGLSLTETERSMMLPDLFQQMGQLQALRQLTYDNSLSPALYFNPFPNGKPPTIEDLSPVFETATLVRPLDEEELAFLPVTHLSSLLHSGQVTSLELTKLYLKRLELYGPKLACVISLLKESALARAAQMDAELKAGHDRGPLHGIPYGIKDLFAVEGTKTTWGAEPYKDQTINTTATVVQRLNDAGAVLLTKLSLGALAMGDVWYGGTTKNPWDLAQGSSGSSAGSSAATAAALVPFSLGTETLGSIVSPSTRCGVTGLRPSFGRVSRSGAMALSWSMDKVGPICRNVEDCALVFNVIRGEDHNDFSVMDAPFPYNYGQSISKVRVGYLEAGFNPKNPNAGLEQSALVVLRDLGIELIPITLPKMPVEAMTLILMAEASAAFESLTLENRDDLLKKQDKNSWPNGFRASHFIPAVAYIQANRARTELIRAMAAEMAKVDVFISPSFAPNLLQVTNLTGHPCVVLPNGLDKDGHPTSISFIGKLFGEAEMLALASAYQKKTGFHQQRPKAYKE